MKNSYYYKMGKAYGYPECCIKEFILRNSTYYLFVDKYKGKKKPGWFGSGFVPCEKCREILENTTRKEFKKWLGRDIYKEAEAIKIRNKVVEEIRKNKSNKVGE